MIILLCKYTLFILTAQICSVLSCRLSFRLPFQNQNGKEENYDANWYKTAAYNNLAKEKRPPHGMQSGPTNLFTITMTE